MQVGRVMLVGKTNGGRKAMLGQINVGGVSNEGGWSHGGRRVILVERVILVGESNAGGQSITGRKDYVGVRSVMVVFLLVSLFMRAETFPE